MPRPSRSPLSRGHVIEAALALVEREGAKKLTMRRLGESLGVEAMSVYEYVTSKQDLISGIAGRLLSELRLDDAYTGPWLERIETVAREWARLAEAHPRVFPLLYEPRQDTQKDVESSELILGALRDGGFDPPSAALAYRALTCLIDGALLRQTSALPAVNAAWRELPEWFDSAQAPHSAEAEEFGSRLQPAEIIDAGIRLMLSGLLEESRGFGGERGDRPPRSQQSRRSSPGKA